MNPALVVVCLVRHAESAWTLTAQHTGRTDLPTVLLFGHREVLRILALRWIGLAPIEGRRLLLATASLGVRGYDRDLSKPVTHAWSGRITAVASAG